LSEGFAAPNDPKGLAALALFAAGALAAPNAPNALNGLGELGFAAFTFPSSLPHLGQLPPTKGMMEPHFLHVCITDLLLIVCPYSIEQVYFNRI
jgi:hypothetical protein